MIPLRGFLPHHPPGRLVGIEGRRGRVGIAGVGIGIGIGIATSRLLALVLLGRRCEVIVQAERVGRRGVVLAGRRCTAAALLPAAAAGACHD